MRIRFIYPWTDSRGKEYPRGAVAELPDGVAVTLLTGGLAVREETPKNQTIAKKES